MLVVQVGDEIFDQLRRGQVINGKTDDIGIAAFDFGDCLVGDFDKMDLMTVFV